MKNYNDFESARDFVRRLQLENRHEWADYCNGTHPSAGELPKDIPPHPDAYYSAEEWAGWSYWLGTGPRRKGKRNFAKYEEARGYAQKLGLSNWSEWRSHVKHLPDNIPATPEVVYKNAGWASTWEWLGTDKRAVKKTKYLSFHHAKAWVRKLGLQSGKEWKDYCANQDLPEDIPRNPQQVYMGEWKSMSDWLGTGNFDTSRSNFRPFEEARAFARALRLESVSQWRKYCKNGYESLGEKPKDIPAAPQQTYKNSGWMGYVDWLGTTNRDWLEFEAARDFVRGLALVNQREYYKYCRENKDRGIPSNPDRFYKDDGWDGWGDWLRG
jgi:hypothetical protein